VVCGRGVGGLGGGGRLSRIARKYIGRFFSIECNAIECGGLAQLSAAELNPGDPSPAKLNSDAV